MQWIREFDVDRIVDKHNFICQKSFIHRFFFRMAMTFKNFCRLYWLYARKILVTIKGMKSRKSERNLVSRPSFVCSGTTVYLECLDSQNPRHNVKFKWGLLGHYSVGAD